jgi:hypothetical protein
MAGSWNVASALGIGRCGTLAKLIVLAASLLGCSFGPRSLMQTRLRYNDAVKTTSEQQFLLNIVRLRYTDTPSSLSISSIADQQELGGTTGDPVFCIGGGDLSIEDHMADLDGV